MFKKLLSCILVAAQFFTCGYIRDAFAFQAQSASFALASGALTQGGAEKLGASLKLRQDIIAEPCAGKSQSASFKLESGFIPTLKLSPPAQIQTISHQAWEENATKDNAFDLDDHFSSPDNLSLSYSVSGNASITVTIDPATHLVGFSQPQAWNGSEQVYFKATDAEGNFVQSNPVTLQVQGVENTPVLTYLPDVLADEGTLVTIAPQASDLDNDEIAYTFTAPLNAQGQWQTDYSDAGLYTVTVTATDTTSRTATQQVRINVRNINRLPVLTHIDDISTSEGDLVVISPVATDADNDPLTFYYASPFDTAGKWLTDYDDAGSRVVTVTVSDGMDTVQQDVNVTVNNTNRAPDVAFASGDYTVALGSSCSLSLSASDPDSDSMTYVIKKDGVVIQEGDLTGLVSLPVTFNPVGDHTATAIVTDSNGLAITKEINIDVVDPNLNPNVINPVMGDFNGDTLMDLGLHNRETGLWEVALSQSGMFTSAVDWLTGFGASVDSVPTGGDFNGDGRTDVGIYNTTTGEFRPAFSTGSGFTAQGAWLTFSGVSASWQIFTGNFNADKYTDLAFYNRDTGEVKVALATGSGFGAIETWSSGAGTGYAAMSGDFNADGLSDLCLFSKTTGNFSVNFSNSRTFVDGGLWISGFAVNRDVMLSDYNHDGMTDVGYWDNTSFSWNYAVSTGSGFVSKGAWLSNFGALTDESATTGDFNGDGITDRAMFDRDAQGINRWKTQVNANKPADLMTEIDNGIGGKTRVTYTYASQFDNQLLPFPVYVASSVTLIDTLPVEQAQESYTQNFAYSGGYYDATEREFRGFAKVTATDPITNNYTETYFYQGKSGQDGALKGQIEKALAYDGNGRQISQVINTYDVRKAGPADNVLGFPALTQVETTVWEENALPITTKSTVAYDNIGNVVTASDLGEVAVAGDERSTTTSYSAAYEAGFNRPLEVDLKDDQGVVVSTKTFEYDAKGNLSAENVSIYNPLTQQTSAVTAQYSYDSFGNLTTTTDALGRSVSTTYETTYHAYPQTITNTLGHAISYVYDPKLGVATSVTDANGKTSTSSYDSFGRVVEARNASNDVVMTYSYPDFNTKITTNALGLSKTEYGDGLGRKYKAESIGEDGAAARAVSSEVYYNNRGQVEKESIAHYIDEDPAQISYVRYEYDLRGRPKKTISDFPGTLKDAESQVNYMTPLYVEAIDPLGHKKGSLKDVYGNVIEVTEFTSDGVFKTQYEYDIQNNLTGTTDSKGNVTQIWYDSIGRKLKMDDPDMGVWTYEYDVLGNLKKQTDAKNQILEFQYDSLNRLTGKLANGQTIVTYLYDDPAKQNCVGRLSKVTDQSGSTEFFYDILGREIKSTKTVDSAPYTVERTYDILDRLTSLKYPDSEVVNYTYDSHSGLLESVASSSGNYVNDTTYNAKGQIKDIQFGNGTQTTYTYGQDLRLSRILTAGTSNLQDLNYVFDKNGNITTLTDNLRSNIRTYSYDSLDRLTQANNVPSPQGGYANFNYQYDAIGNMTYKSDVGVMTYGINAGPHAVTTAGGYNYSYDANGNMTQGKNKTLEYDAENRIIRINQLGVITDFVYDGDGGRVKKITPTGTTTYIGSLFEIDSASGKATKHIFAGSNKVCSVESTGNKYFIHSDHLGSSSVVTDQNGAQVSHYEYTPYGSVAQVEGSDVTGYKFTGKELDNTGLYFYGARYYDPEIGRFVTADTIVQAPYNPQTLNRYSYCANNPLNYVDPSGHFWFIAAIIGAIIGAASSAATGGNIGLGALTGALSGILFAGAGVIVGNMGLQGLAAASVYAGAGAISGAASAGITGGNIGIGALIGGLGGAIGYGVSSWAGDNLIVGFLGAAATGAVLGGMGSTLLGGSFGDGAWQGAASAGISYSVSTVAKSISQKPKTEAEKQDQQREAPQTQAKLDEGYAKGGPEGQTKAAAEIAIATQIYQVQNNSTTSNSSRARSVLTISPEKVRVLKVLWHVAKSVRGSSQTFSSQMELVRAVVYPGNRPFSPPTGRDLVSEIGIVVGDKALEVLERESN